MVNLQVFSQIDKITPVSSILLVIIGRDLLFVTYFSLKNHFFAILNPLRPFQSP